MHILRWTFPIWAALAAATPSTKKAPCGAITPSAEQQAQVESAIAKGKTSAVTPNAAGAGSSKHIAVNWHTINGDSSSVYVYHSDALAQVNVLNDRFTKYGFTFYLNLFDHYFNSSWADSRFKSPEDYDMKYTLRRGNYYALNIYSVDVPRGGEEPYQGFGTFPEPNATPDTRTFVFDGVTLAKEVLVNGSAYERELGVTAVHEVGHWLNLFHPFDTGNCFDAGDHVQDTPRQEYPSYGCPKGKDSCPTYEGVDSIHNYMDYSADYCRTEFTPDQITRAEDAFHFIRVLGQSVG